MNVKDMLRQASDAAKQLITLSDQTIIGILKETAQVLRTHTEEVLAANRQDLERMDPANPKYDRLKLTEERLQGISADMENVSTLPSPLNKVLSETTRPNGMVIRKVTVPFGVIGVIYEARPNVTFDVFSLCFRSGNVCVLKGGSDADFSNRALVRIIHSVLERQGINPAVCTLLPPDREATAELLGAVGLVDLIIPRGSSSLIHFVREHAKVPVIETGAGICHTYFDRSGDKGKGREIVNNAKTRRVSVCNALDCLIIHRERLSDLPYICGKLPDSNVIIYADEPAYAALSEHYPETLLQQANENSFGTEFLDYKMSIRTVSSLDEALSHIARYSSKHSESIISEDPETIRRFQQLVDAACVYANVSTAFTDGAQFGFGAEIGISTQKLHARGPMALPELTTYKAELAGDKDVTQYELLLGDVDKREVKKVDINRWPDQYIDVLYTTNDGKRLYFQRYNRSWNQSDICEVDVETGQVRVVIHEENKPYLDYQMRSVSFLKDGKEILFRSERNGWGHYYLYDTATGNLKKQVTDGTWVAGPIAKIDTVGRKFYFYGYGREKSIDPYYYILYEAKLDQLNAIRLLTPENASHEARISPSNHYIVDSYSTVSQEPVNVVRNSRGKVVMKLEKPDLQPVYEMGWKAPERFKVKAGDGVTDLYGVMWKPADFDSTKVYPIISNVYPGPFFEYVPTGSLRSI